jgi:hypothetical protein
MLLATDLIYTKTGNPHTGQSISYKCDRCNFKFNNRRYCIYVNSRKKWDGDYCHISMVNIKSLLKNKEIFWSEKQNIRFIKNHGESGEK